MAWHLSADHEVSLFSPLSDDTQSDELIQQIRSQRIQFIGPRLKGSIPSQEIELREDGEKIFSPFNHGVLKQLPNLEIKLDFKNFDIVMGPVHKETLPYFESFLRDKKDNQELFLDFTTLKEFDYDLDLISHLHQQSTLMQFSPAEENQKLVEKIKTIELRNQQVILLTLGAQGGVLRNSESLHLFQPPKIEEVKDTTGAGDAFFSTFANYFLNKESLDYCLQQALMASKLTISRVGSSPLRLDN
ncbi:MAG: carbohydrate kinase family protein [Deltaproteobacteria bacterium]|nr:MAG: carbohydrate kinase family protein [Deltaproteobacteria bacterium]